MKYIDSLLPLPQRIYSFSSTFPLLLVELHFFPSRHFFIARSSSGEDSPLVFSNEQKFNIGRFFIIFFSSKLKESSNPNACIYHSASKPLMLKTNSTESLSDFRLIEDKLTYFATYDEDSVENNKSNIIDFFILHLPQEDAFLHLCLEIIFENYFQVSSSKGLNLTRQAKRNLDNQIR